MKDELKAVQQDLRPSPFQLGRAGAATARPPAFSSGEMSEGVEVIINAAAGGGSEDDERARAVEEAFAACGVGARVSVAGGGAEVTELARRALSNGARAVVAGGGDGTVGSV